MKSVVVRTWLRAARGEPRGPAAGAARLLLWLGSLPYGLIVRARNRLYDSGRWAAESAGVPVVSVGNLTVGGTGKTPCVAAIARYFRSQDLRVAILSRGYGGAGGANDEFLELEEQLPDVPHLQGADRVRLAHTAVEELESEILILDDGFQHRRLARACDIVLIDASDPCSLEHLLPRGSAREPLSGLKRADVIVLTRCDQVRDVGKWKRRFERFAPVVESVHRPAAWRASDGREWTLDQFHGRPTAAFAGVGHPEAFRRTLAGIGHPPVEFRTFPDHHAYTRTDVDALRAWADRLPADAMVATTHKDMVKLQITALSGRPLLALRIEWHPTANAEAFFQRLDALTVSRDTAVA